MKNRAISASKFLPSLPKPQLAKPPNDPSRVRISPIFLSLAREFGGKIPPKQLELAISLRCQIRISTAGPTCALNIGFYRAGEIPITLDSEVAHPSDARNQSNQLEHFQRSQIGAEWKDILVAFKTVI